jgi:hypothetical protein
MSLLGKLIYKLYFQPKGKKAVEKKFGGKQNYSGMLAAEQEMKRYALDDLVIKSNFNGKGPFKINFLTGDKFIHQTLFCTYSFFKFLSAEESRAFSVHYYSDGTLSDPMVETLKTRFPQIRVIGPEETKVAIEDHLPKSAFPNLNKKIAALPLFKKLIYPHLNNQGSSTFFDSDMLFIKRPEVFINWLYQKGAANDHAFCIKDAQRSYGYSDAEILKVWPNPIKNDINSGMYSLFSENMDFRFIENLVGEFERHFGSQYYMEQLITAIILERSGDLFVAPPSEYIVLPTNEQIKDQVGILHHYVNESKEFYFKESWKKQVFQ